MSSETELAWAAGFFDGEGNTSIQHRRISKKTGKPFARARMAVVQCGDGADKILNRFRDAVGGRGKVSGPFARGKSHWKLRWIWTCQVQSEIEEIVRILTPYLCEVKIAQANRILAERGERPPRGYAPLEYCKKGLHLMSETARERPGKYGPVRVCMECTRANAREKYARNPESRKASSKAQYYKKQGD